MEEIISIKAKWDVEDATFITRELYKYVAKNEIRFKVEAKNGSVDTQFHIEVLRDLAIGVGGTF